jgi:hypothetical protein
MKLENVCTGKVVAQVLPQPLQPVVHITYNLAPIYSPIGIRQGPHPSQAVGHDEEPQLLSRSLVSPLCVL